jgi:hypothetical protein
MKMYREEDKKQQKIEDFYLPFGGKLNEQNRWVILSNKIPWNQIEEEYKNQLANTGMGAPAKSVRMALGALIIKEKLQLSDREVVEHIRETPYLQYFIGLEDYQDEEPFDPSLMVHFRKRLNGEILNKANEILFKEYRDAQLKKKRQIQKRLKRRKR